MPQTQALPLFPEVGEIFELSTSTEMNGTRLFTSLGHCSVPMESSSQMIPAGTTRRFKLVKFGSKAGVDRVVHACKAGGYKVPSGCWMKAFRDLVGYSFIYPVGIADASFQTGQGRSFPRLLGALSSHVEFRWAGANLPEMLWLVEVDK